MKLLFDENLSRNLVQLLADVYRETVHVSDLGLLTASDERIWAEARNSNLVIVTKDSDFHERSLMWGAPPKVLWLRCGNLRTVEIASLLRANVAFVTSFVDDPVLTYLAVYP